MEGNSATYDYETMVREGQHVGIFGSVSHHLGTVGPIASWFAQHWERQGEDWKVALTCPRMEWARDNFRKIVSWYPFPCEVVQPNLAIHGRHGMITCIFDNEREVRSTYAKHLLWLVESNTPSTWQIIVSHMQPGTQIIGFEPPPGAWHLFPNLVEIGRKLP